MTIVASDLKVFRSQNSVTGGRMSSSEIPSGVAGAIFSNATQDEREAGSDTYVKVFYKVHSSSNDMLAAAKVYQDTSTPGEDAVVFCGGTQRNTRAELGTPSRFYGACKLHQNVSSGAQGLSVVPDQTGVLLFEAGDLVRISSKVSFADVFGNEEYATVATVNTADNVISLTFTSDAGLSYAYAAANTRVCAVLEVGDVIASVTDPVISKVAGNRGGSDPSFDTATHPITLNATSVIEQDWVLTFTSTTTFSIVGDTLGTVGVGNVTSGAGPGNPAVSQPYFVISSPAFSGTWLLGDTISFSTHPSAIPLFLRRVIPANCPVQAANTAVIVLRGDTV